MWQRAAIFGTPVLVLAAAVTLWNSDPSPAAAPPLPSVTVAAPLQREVNRWDDYVGRFEASRSVEVRPRVSGQIVGIHFRDGQIVQKGQLLFTVDPRPFARRWPKRVPASRLPAANWRSRRPTRSRAPSARSDAVSQAKSTNYGAGADGHAALAAAQARVRQRALDVEFTRVRAPISGRISDRQVDAGNLVAGRRRHGGTLLTTINALDPIYFTFDGSEALYLKASAQRSAGARATPSNPARRTRATYSSQGQARLHRQWHRARIPERSAPARSCPIRTIS